MKKKLIAVALCLVMLLSFTAPFASAETEKDMSTEEYTVVYASEELAAAAQKLSEYLEKVTGKAPDVVPSAPAGAYILLKTDPSVVGSGYEIKADGKNISITGSTLQYTVRGVYGFLEKYCGVNCYTSKLTVYKQNGITLPPKEGYVYTPFFEFTDTDWISPKDGEYSLFNGFNSDEYREIPAELGGTVDYISRMAHSLATQFCSRDTYFEEHPEYFALRGGKRKNSQLCLTNPDVLKIVTDEVFALLEEKHDPDADLQIISLTQDDNFNFCRCDKCKAVDRKYGSHAGSMLEFVNAVAREVKAAGYDNVAIDTFAYQYTRKVPTGIVPEDNVIVRLCSIECCFSHPFDEADCKANAAFLADLEGWSKICDRMYIWDYCTDFTNYVGLFPDLGVLQRDIQLFYEHNVKGIYEEGNYSGREIDTEFGELRAYMIGKLMQDPYCDITAVRNDFLDNYYGAGGEHIAAFLDIITEDAPEKHMGIYHPMGDTLSLSKAQIKECDALWEQAKNAAEGEAKTNVIHSELSWRYWKMKNHASEFSSLFGRKAEKQKLTDEINAASVVWAEFDGYRAFFVELYQRVAFKLYPVVSFVMKHILYRL